MYIEIDCIPIRKYEKRYIVTEIKCSVVINNID